MNDVLIRKAKPGDLTEIVYLLKDDDFEGGREGEVGEYKEAFKELLSSDSFDVFVMEKEKKIIGCYQAMYLPHLNFRGTRRCQIENVRIHSDFRGQGFGKKLIEHAMSITSQNSCGIFQLTSNKKRSRANKFYCQLGLEPTHEGYKFYLDIK